MEDHAGAKSSAAAATAALVPCISDHTAADLAENRAAGWADPTLGTLI